ncbi:hypothetical protein AVEN_14384-1 [Araneus ventricosus]|uniref:Uncharacterized protein n=1 Tax=Araneus ventricosus TaxID=182803 RepID=A0A4Y2M2L9_ARAVE|nr:hypothetical protein AVEN_14384-1 [Araneus ventricosus]
MYCSCKSLTAEVPDHQGTIKQPAPKTFVDPDPVPVIRPLRAFSPSLASAQRLRPPNSRRSILRCNKLILSGINTPSRAMGPKNYLLYMFPRLADASEGQS